MLEVREPSMSIISCAIPAFNEGQRLPPFLADLARVAAGVRDITVEFVIVDDGSRTEDRALEQECVERAQSAMRAAGTSHQFRFVQAPQNGGKGSAIRLGWAESIGDAAWLGFVDADGSISAEELFRVARGLGTAKADVVAGSRIKMAGRYIERNLFRHLQGRVFATLVEQAFGLGFYDTQCGLKFVRASHLRPQLGALQEQGWMLDVELLARTKELGGTFEEVPIDWVDVGDSKVRFGIDALRMFIAIRRIRQRLTETPLANVQLEA